MTSTTAPFDLTLACGLPETVLPDDLLARLPDASTVAAAPWRTRCQVASWLHPVEADALAAFPEPIRPSSIAVVAWALVRYDETPVGPYSELAATLLPDDGVGHIPFIVVDSLTSIVGGRVNWLLPKALADFSWSEDFTSVSIAPVEPAAPAWSAAVSVAVAGEATPLTIPSRLRQVSTAGLVGSCEGSMAGAMRPATVTVEATASGLLAALLKPGRYDATVMADCDFTCGALA